MQALSDAFQPQLVSVKLADVAVIAAAEKELREHATTDVDRCFGYFPGMKGKVDLQFELPACRAFAERFADLDVAGKQLHFNFLRMSLVQQPAQAPYHVDTDAATALTGVASTTTQRMVWRLLLNLSDQHDRTLSYLDIDSISVQLNVKGGYVSYPETPDEAVRRIAIPPRAGEVVQGVLFCASRVLHAGQDDQYGHFVAGYGRDD